MRFGYESHPANVDGGVDSGMTLPDGSISDAAADGGGGSGGGGMDAGKGDAAVLDASDGPGDGGDSGSGGGSGNGGTDAGDVLDAGMPDSGEPDSGLTDSGTTDSGTADPVKPIWTEDCPGIPEVLFCDDFEDGDISTKWDTPIHMRGSTARTTDQKHAGTYAMRATTSASTSTVQSRARLPVQALGHRKSGDLWARYFYYLPSSVTLTQKFSTGVISEHEDPFFGFSVVIYPDGVGLESGLQESKNTSTTFPRDTWVCVEMHVRVDASAGSFELYMDSTLIPTGFTSLDTLPDQGYTNFEIGVHYADFNQGAITVYTDDVKLGTSRLGCN